MKYSHYLAIAVRLFAIALFISGLERLIPAIQLVITGTVNGMTASLLLTIMLALIPMTISLILWYFPLSVTYAILKPESDKEIPPLPRENLLAVALITLGLYTFYYAISDSLFWLYILHMSSNPESNLYMGTEDKANLVISLIELILALALVFRSGKISAIVLKLSR